MGILDWNWSLGLMDWVLGLITVLGILYYLCIRSYNRFSKYNIPHLKPYPIVGSLGKDVTKEFPYLVQDFYNKLKEHQYGGCYFFSLPIFFITDPELIKAIAVKDFEYFTDHRSLTQRPPGKEDVFTKGLFTLKGQRWKEMRATLSPAFTSSKMKTMFVLISDCCKQLVDFLEENQHKSVPGCNISKENEMMVLELKEFFTRYTNDVIATTAFGVGVDSLKQPNNEFFVMGQDVTNIPRWRFLALVLVPKLMIMLGIDIIKENVTEFFRSLVLDTMRVREEKGIVRPDMLQLMMEAKKNALSKDNENDKKIKLDDEDIVAQAVLFFLAGFDTASTLLCFTCYMIATHPEVHQKLQDEVDNTLEENEGKFTYETVNNMRYLDMVVSETLRIYPPVAVVDRVCNRRYTLKADTPCEFFPGDYIYFPVYGLHHDPKYYPEPEKFDPERFSDENKHKINPFTYLPFGVGPRSCIGNRFALMEAKLVLAYMLAKFNIRTVSKTPEYIKIVQKGFNISIAGGFWMGLQMRNF